MTILKNRILTALVAISAISFYCYQQAVVFLAWTPVPYVDTWPVLHRFMQWDHGGVNTVDYLLSPHGAHLHSVVYALYWIDIYLFGGQQFFVLVAAQLAILATSLLIAWLFLEAGLFRNWSRVTTVLSAAIAALALGTANGSTLHIFQTVLVATRLADLIVFIGLVHSLARSQVKTFAIWIALACAVGTFHGSGLLFCLIFALICLALGRSWRWRVAGIVPLMVVGALNKLFIPAGAGEFSSMLSVVFMLNMDRFTEIVMGLLGYYMTPWVHWWSARTILPEPFLAFLALVTAGVTSYWGCRVGTEITMKVWRGQTLSHSDQIRGGIALAALIVPISALSAAMFFAARQLIDPALYPSVYTGTLMSGRYACFAILGYVQLLFILCDVQWNRVTKALALTSCAGLFTLIFLMQNALWSTPVRDRFIVDIDTLPLLMTNEKTAENISSSSWPAVISDDFWKVELPKTVDYLRSHNLSIFRNIPRLGEHISPADIAGEISNDGKPYTQPTSYTPSKEKYCAFRGHANIFRTTMFSWPRYVAMANSNNEVVGMATVLPKSGFDADREIQGLVSCAYERASRLSAVIKPFPLVSQVDLCSDLRSTAVSTTTVLKPVDYSDGNWKHGVWNKRDGQNVFFVEAQDLEIPRCSILVFEGSGTAGVSRTMKVADKYINIYVSKRLNPVKDGGPHMVMLVSPKLPPMDK